MKNKWIIIPLFIAVVVFTSGFIYKNNNGHRGEDKWSGTVSFVITRINIGSAEDFSHKTEWNIRHEWRMEADINNNFGIARSIIKGNGWGKNIDKIPPHSFSGSSTDTTFCWGEDSTELTISIFKEDNEYGFSISVPASKGVKIQHSIVDGIVQPITRYDQVEDESSIIVEGYKLGANPNILEGEIIEKDTLPTDPGIFQVITYIKKWKLVKNGKKNIPKPATQTRPTAVKPQNN